MNEKEPHPKNTITDNEMNIGGNFHQGNNQIFLGNLPEMLTLSSDPIKFSKTDRIAEIIKNINRMASEELAKELTIHILNHIRKSKKKSLVQSIAFEEDLLEWINIIFYDHNEQLKPSFICIRDEPNYIFHEKRAVIDVEEFLHDDFEKIEELRHYLIRVKTK